MSIAELEVEDAPLPAVIPRHTARMTAEELEHLSDSDSMELVDGELREKNVGGESSWIAFKLTGLIYVFLARLELGAVFLGDMGFRCFAEDQQQVRKPDLSFVRWDRLPGRVLPKGFLRIAPDFAVEVVSPNDFYSDVLKKVTEYLAAGVSLVWVVDPESRGVLVFSAGSASCQLLKETDELTGGDVLPGFRCTVQELFPPRQPVEAPPVDGPPVTDLV